MNEQKQNIVGSIGYERSKLLFAAKIEYARGRFPESERYIHTFLSTISEGNEESEVIKAMLDEVEQIRQEKIKKLEETLKSVRILEGNDLSTATQDSINSESILDMINVCQMVSDKYGLFF